MTLGELNQFSDNIDNAKEGFAVREGDWVYLDDEGNITSPVEPELIQALKERPFFCAQDMAIFLVPARCSKGIRWRVRRTLIVLRAWTVKSVKLIFNRRA